MAYSYYSTITVDNTKVSGSANLTNFTILINGTYDGTGGEPDLRTTANGGKIQNTDATGGADGATTVPADLVFSPNVDGSSPYDFEVEKYTATTGELIAWVEIPTLLYNSDTTLYMTYGDSGVTTSQENVTGAWGAYGGVYHLNKTYNGTAGEVKDSTGNNNGTNDSTTKSSLVTGVVGSGQDFNSNAAYDFDDVTTFDGATHLAIEMWFNPDTMSAPDVFVRKWLTGNASFTFQTETSTDLILFVHDGTNQKDWKTTNASWSTSGGWYHITAVWDASDNAIYFYQNGTTLTTTTGSLNQTVTSINNSSAELLVGAYNAANDGAYNYFADGQMDELRISTSESVSVDWAYTNYNNQNSPGTFYSVGSETAVPAAGGIAASRRSIQA